MTTELDDHAHPITRRLYQARAATRDANELCGVARGILADGAINQSEAEYLLCWLQEHPAALDVWPFNILLHRLQEMLSDGKLSSDEEAELIGILVDYTGGGSTQPGASASGHSTALPLCEPAPTVVFEGRNFVLTGRFVTGTRSECEAEIIKRGGQPQKNPCRTTHFVVIGELGSGAWAQSSYGRKIQHAVELREDGHPIHLISERHWADWL